jgi:hypothetical protein
MDLTVTGTDHCFEVRRMQDDVYTGTAASCSARGRRCGVADVELRSSEQCQTIGKVLLDVLWWLVADLLMQGGT